MSMLRYQWNAGVRYSVDPAPVGKAIEDLGKRLGKPFDGVTPADVVEEARSDDSPLHPLFTWDDSEAAEKYRQYQAGTVIRALRVVYVGDVDMTPHRLAVSVRPENEDGSLGDRAYITLTAAARNASLRRQMIDDSLRLLNGVRDRVAELQGAGAAVANIDKAVAVLQKIQARDKAAKAIPATASA